MYPNEHKDIFPKICNYFFKLHPNSPLKSLKDFIEQNVTKVKDTMKENESIVKDAWHIFESYVLQMTHKVNERVSKWVGMF